MTACSRRGFLSMHFHLPIRLSAAQRIAALVTMSLVIASLSSVRAEARDRSAERLQPSGPIHLDQSGRKWAEKALRKMSLEEKVGQLFMIWVRVQFMNQDDPVWIQLRDTVGKYHIGSLVVTVPAEGVLLYKSEPYEAAELLNSLQRDSKLPLLFAADFERGVSMRLNGAVVFPHAMAFGATGKPENAEEFGRITATEARAIGVQWNLFPDADVNSNPANPIINTRSFGEDPRQVGDFVAAYIKGAHEGGMLATAKHFPGHGDTATDSHLGLAEVNGDRARLDAVELPPFRRAIEAGVDAVMVAHVKVPSLDPDPRHVATTSPAVVDQLLKKHLGFKGVVVTDALDMGALTRLYANDTGRAAVDALKAGNDLLLIPADLDQSYHAVLRAVQGGEITRQRLDDSVRKILELKASLGLGRGRLVDMGLLAANVGKPENMLAGQRIADQAITVVRDNGRVFPLEATAGTLSRTSTGTLSGTLASKLPYQSLTQNDRLVAVIFSDDLRGESGRMLERQILARAPGARIIYVDSKTADAMEQEISKEVAKAGKVIAALYMVPTAGRVVHDAAPSLKSVPMEDATANLLNSILGQAADRTVVIAMGNPYVIADFPAIQNYLCAFSNVTVSETAAVRAIFGEISIQGHLPVSIPGVAMRGQGLERAAKSISGDTSHAQ
jgi:beta-N-acetylhexosaminidase